MTPGTVVILGCGVLVLLIGCKLERPGLARVLTLLFGVASITIGLLRIFA